SSSERKNRISYGCADPQGIQGCVGASLCKLDDFFRSVVVRVDGVNRSQFFRFFQLFLVDVDGDHVGSQCGPDLHCGQSDAPAAVYREPFTRGPFQPSHHTVEGSHESAAQSGGSDEIDAFRKVNHVDICIGNPNVLGVSTIIMNSDKLEMVAYIMMTVDTMFTASTAVVEGDDHSIPFFEPGDSISHFFHDAGEFVTHYEWQFRFYTKARP